MIRFIFFLISILSGLMWYDTYVTSVHHFQWQNNAKYVKVWRKSQDVIMDYGSIEWLYNFDYQSLADSLTVGAQTKEEKAARIYRYLTTNITYKLDGLIRAPAKCLRQKNGVCTSISQAFVKLSQAAGIEAHVVTGYTGHLNETERHNNHAWVIWQDEKGKHLGDPTWDLGSDKYRYYKIDPKEMIKTHYPLIKADQLLCNPLIFNQWEVLSANGQKLNILPSANSFDRILRDLGIVFNFLTGDSIEELGLEARQRQKKRHNSEIPQSEIHLKNRV